MNIPEIFCHCPSKADFKSQKDSCNHRVTAVVIGILLLLGCTLILSRLFDPQHQIPNWIGYASGVLGIIVLALAGFAHFQRKAEEHHEAPLPQFVPKVETKPIEDPNQKKASEHLSKGDLEESLTEIKKVSDNKIKEPFILKIAEAYYQKNDHAHALKVIKVISQDTISKENMIIKVAKAFFDENDIDKVIEVIYEILKDTLNSKLIEANNHVTMWSKATIAARKEFCANVANQLYQQVASYLKENKSDDALKYIKNSAEVYAAQYLRIKE